MGKLKGGGGSFVVLTKDSVFHGPGNKTGWLTASSLDSLETVASFDNGNAIVVAGDVCFILTDSTLTASNYVTKEVLWSVDCDCSLALVLAGSTLFVGGQDQVAASNSLDGQRIWAHPVDGKAYGLAVAQGRLLVSTDTGAIHAFQAGSPTDSPHQPLSQSAVNQPTGDAAASSPDPSATSDRVAVGPWWKFTAPDTAVFRSRTRTPSPTHLTQRYNGHIVQQIVDDTAKLEHEVALENLGHNVTYTVQVEFLDQGQLRRTAEYECDTFFNYSLPFPAAASNASQKAAKMILQETQISAGLGLCLGCEDGNLISSLLAQVHCG